MPVTCVFTVASPRYSSAAISAFDRPRARALSTSTSRSVSGEPSGDAFALRWLADVRLDEPAGDGGGKQQVTGMARADGCRQLVGWGGFQQKAAGSCS